MEFLYITGSLFLFLCSLFLSLYIFIWWKKQEKEKYKSNTAHFLSDLVKLKRKWVNLGEVSYGESLEQMIRFYGVVSFEKKDGGVGQPYTAEALNTIANLKKNRQDEVREVVNEIVDEIEFRG